jgi:hypothetical protein
MVGRRLHQPPTAWLVDARFKPHEEGRPDLLIWDPRVRFPSSEEATQKAMGGSEVYAVMLCTELVKRGHKVAIAHGGGNFEFRGVQCVNTAQLRSWRCWPTKSLVVQRSHHIGYPTPPLPPTVVILAHDTYNHGYDVHAPVLSNGRARLICNSKWQAAAFKLAKDRRAVYPMVGVAPETEKVKGRFVYGSGVLKGLPDTVGFWKHLRKRYPEKMRDQRLLIIHPGWGDGYGRYANAAFGIEYAGAPSTEEYRRLVASAEGLFFVNTYPETWCNLAVIAERARTRTHILCKVGRCGIPEGLSDSSLVTDSPIAFEQDFIAHLGAPLPTHPVVDRSPAAMIATWEEALGLVTPPSDAALAAPAVGGL